MAKCHWCKQDMMDEGAVSCSGNTVIDEFSDGVTRPAVPYFLEGVDKDHRCHDCNVKLGGYHHPGCDMEVCPKCGGQLISCGCLTPANDSSPSAMAEGEDDMNKADKIKSDLKKRFPRAEFSVKVGRGDEVTVDFVRGHDYADEFPDTKAAVREIVKVVRKTVPNFQWTDYTTKDGTVYA